MKFKVKTPLHKKNRKRSRDSHVYRQVLMSDFLQAKIDEVPKKYFETEKSYTRRILRSIIAAFPSSWELVPDDEVIVERANPR